jgi:hypothetical protein
MFEKANPFSVPPPPVIGGRRVEDGTRARHAVSGAAGVRGESRPARRASDALRAVEWSEITARLKAARDLRLLMRHESQGRIEAVAASFGDAAASYFAMIEDDERVVNPDALEASKAFGDMDATHVDDRYDRISEGDTANLMEAPGGDAREIQ